ncbi:DUF4160 domain-containing protein [Longimicrobium sp.]|uniref:DUF4160 domain-containing protein n=1 Tax=Longimicrobium sp. TaxID=2029185 RepID=UPI002D1C2CD5|nr:DUF4160 domain-containing protein [Longimicrobium sp.]HSU17816.1 DUF4160 domain-containing protein [Longimicrobium sp.]
MPVILRVDGFSFGFYAAEHDPPHVHVAYSGAYVIVNIGSGNVRKNCGMKRPDMLRAVRLVQTHQDQLLASWVAFDQKRKKTNGVASH